MAIKQIASDINTQAYLFLVIQIKRKAKNPAMNCKKIDIMRIIFISILT